MAYRPGILAGLRVLPALDWNREVIFLDKEFQQIARNAEIGRM